MFIDEEKETLKSSYEILHREIQKLFKENWEKIKTGNIRAKKQTGGVSTTRETLPCLNHLSDKRGGIHQSENLKNNITDVNLNDIRKEFEQLVPSGDRSKVINEALRKELNLLKRKRLTERLVALRAKSPLLSTDEIVAIVRKDRNRHKDRYDRHYSS